MVEGVGMGVERMGRRRRWSGWGICIGGFLAFGWRRGRGGGMCGYNLDDDFVLG